MNRGLKALCWASFLWTMSTLMVISTFTIYQEQSLHFSKVALGSIQAYANLSMHLTKLFSGLVVDALKDYKSIMVIGSVLSALAKPFFATTTSFMGIFYLRTLERLTKGIRQVPVEAYVSAIQKKEKVGLGFALKQMSYTFGAVAGCLVSSGFLWMTSNNFQLLYILAATPGLIATVIVVLYIVVPKDAKRKKRKFQWNSLLHFPKSLWYVVTLTLLVWLARFGENYMGHRFMELGMPTYIIPLTYIFFNLPMGFASYGVRNIYDNRPWIPTFTIGMVFLTITDLLFFWCNNFWLLLMGSVCAGIHMALTQGLFLTLIARNIPSELRGTAYAIYYLATGIGIFATNKITGHLGQICGTWGASFGFNVVMSLIVIIFCLISLRSKSIASY